MFVKYIRLFIKNYLMTFFALVFVAAYWMSAYKLPMATIQYPLVITIILLIFCAWNIWLSIGEFKKVYTEAGDDREKYDISLGFDKKKLLVVAGTFLYAVCIPIVGYIVSTVIYLGSMCYYLGVRKPVVLVLYSLVLTAIFYLIFESWLSVRVPTGFLI